MENYIIHVPNTIELQHCLQKKEEEKHYKIEWEKHPQICLLAVDGCCPVELSGNTL